MAAKKMKHSVWKGVVFGICLALFAGCCIALTMNGISLRTETAEERSLTLLSLDNQIFYIDYEEHDDSAENDRYIGRTFAFELGYRIGTETFAFSEEDAPLSAAEGEPLFTCTVKDKPFEGLTVAQDPASRGTFTVRLKEDPAAQEGFEDFLDDPVAIGGYWECPVKVTFSPAGYDPVEFYLILMPRPSYTVTLELNGGSRKEDKPLYAWVGVPLDDPGDPTPPFTDPADDDSNAEKSPEEYLFDGWYLVDPEGNTAEKYDFDANYYFDSDITLRARYKSALTVCDFTETEGDGVKETSRILKEGNAEYTVYYNEPLPGPLPGAAEMAETEAAGRGWTFGGWFTEEGGKGTENGLTAAKGGPVFTARPKLYAKWYCMGQFDPVFGAAIAEREIVWRAPVDLPAPVYNNGGIFEGWYFEDSLRLPASAENVLFDLTAVTPAEGVLPLKAWVKFPVILNWDDSDGVTARVENGGYVRYQGTMADLGGSLPASGTKLKESGWNFANWYRNFGGKEGEFTASTTYTEAKALTLYAKWSSDFTLRRSLDEDGRETALVLDKNGEILLDAETQKKFEVVYHAGLVLPEPVTAVGKDNGGWAFGGWFTEDHGGGTEVTDLVGEETYLAEGARTLFARWTGTIVFDYSLPDLVVGEPTPSLPLIYGALLPTLPAPVYTNSGTFRGWFCGEGGNETQYETGSAYKAAATLELHDRIGFPVSFNYQDEALDNDPKLLHEAELLYGKTWLEAKVTLPAEPVKQKWTFDAWYLPDDTKVKETEAYMGTGPLEVTAMWQSWFTMRRELNITGSPTMETLDPLLVTYNRPFPRTDVLTAGDWRFCGFYTEQGGGGERFHSEDGAVDPASPYHTAYTGEGSRTLFAKWSTTVTFDYTLKNAAVVDGKTDSIEVVYHAPIKGLPSPKYSTTDGTGEFVSWNLEPNGKGTEFRETDDRGNEIDYTLGSALTVYAKVRFSLTVDAQNDTDPTSYDVYYGWTLAESGTEQPRDPTKYLWTFDRWHEGQGVGAPEFNFNRTYDKEKSMTVYAWWYSRVRLWNVLDINGRPDPSSYDDSLQVFYGQPFKPLEGVKPSAQGWTFGGYYDSDGEQLIGEDGKAASPDKNYTGIGSPNLWAKWRSQATFRYTLENNVVGEKVTSCPIAYNDPLPKLPEPKYGGDGISAGWFGEDGKQYKEKDIYQGAPNLVLTNEVKFPVTVDYQDETLNAQHAEERTFLATYGKQLNESLSEALLDRPVKSGWDFDDWHDATIDGKIVTGNTTYDYETSITVYAWWKSDFTLKKELGDTGAADEGVPLTVHYNQPIPHTAALTAGEWVFGGYYTEAGGNGAQIFSADGSPLSTSPYTEAAARTLFAKWSTTATFVYTLAEKATFGEGQKMESVPLVYKAEIPTLPLPQYESGLSKGWFTAEYGDGTECKTGEPYTGTACPVLYNRVDFTLTLDYQDDALNGAERSFPVTYGKTLRDSGVSLPGSPQKGGSWQFDNWHDATIDGKPVTGNTTYDYETSVTLYAWWKSDFTLKKELGDTGAATDAAVPFTVRYNQPIPNTAALTAGEWVFGGYYTEAGGNGAQIFSADGSPLSTGPYTEAAARTLFAKWSTTIRFEVGGGEKIPAGTSLGTPSRASMGVVYHHKIGELPTVSYAYSEQEREQKVKFEGWYPTYYGFQSGTGLSTDALSADALYTGVAGQTFHDRTSIQIVFYDPLNNVSSSGKIYFGLSATDSGFNIPTFNRPTQTGRSGWRFSGWRATFGRETAELSSNELNERVYTETVPITFTAIWKVTLKYHADRGQIVNVLGSSDTVEVEYGKEVTLLSPTAADCSWEFTGWCYSSDMKKSDNAPISNTFQTKNEDFVKYVDEHSNGQLQVDLYARWVMDIVTLDYGAADKENADLPQSVRNVVYGGAPIEDIPDAEEIKFPANNWYNRGSGWFADDAFTGESIIFRNTDNYPRRMETLYYQWIGKTLHVSLMYFNQQNVSTTDKQFDVPMGGIVTEIMGKPSGMSGVVESFLGYYWFKTAPKSFDDTKSGSSLLQDAVLCFDGGGYQHTDWEFVPEGQLNIDLYAVWGRAFTVTINWNDGSDKGTTISQVKVAEGNPLPSYTAQHAPIRTGYTFRGYYENTEGTGIRWYDENMTAFDAIWTKGDATLYAKWDANPLTVTADADSASDLGEKTITFTVTGGTGSYSYSDSGGDGVSCSWNGNKLTIEKEKNGKSGTITVTVKDNNSKVTSTYKISYSTSSCLAPGSMITMADGSEQPIEDVKIGDKVLAWDFRSQSFVTAEVLIATYHGDSENEIVNLNFANGNVLRIIGEHVLFDMETRCYVTLRVDNYAEYIGHDFLCMGEDGYTVSALVSADVTVEYTGVYSLVTAYYFNYVADGIVNTSPVVPGIYELLASYLKEDFTFDSEQFESDVEQYGLYEYELFREYMSYEQFLKTCGPYFKLAVEKGFTTWDIIWAVVTANRAAYQ